ncbi:hypothetical protein ACTG16_23155 [Aeromonas sp. 23P]|uniref:hypothetical protein n=1 Tax=Aeromonas sp. 23P TaxID=3452716 RepID=UPI003F7A4427|nr:hypothetical protein [Aeromonas veronii]
MYDHLTKYELLCMLQSSNEKLGRLAVEIERERQKNKDIEDALEKICLKTGQ